MRRAVKVPVRPVKPVKLTVEVLQATVSRDRHAVLRCLERYRPLLPSAAGSVKVKWTVELDGDVSGVEVLEPAIKSTPLEACMIKGVKAFRFPKNLGPVRAMTIPFVYRDPAGSAEQPAGLSARHSSSVVNQASWWRRGRRRCRGVRRSWAEVLLLSE